MRLDEALVQRNLSPSRSRARDQVLRGCVLINGLPARKASQNVSDADLIAMGDDGAHYVSRAALKLVHALDAFGLSPKDKSCLDVGASTGGFTQVLLERGAAHVTALDVGHGQLHPVLAGNGRVTVLEGVNAREYTPDAATNLIVCDVSFISLKTALPLILDTVQAGCQLIALIKPQFEVGRDLLPRDGIVKDDALHAAVSQETSRFLDSWGWRVQGILDSPITGGDGNREFLIAATKT
jgi:23S rRNA (cytidine1920-2'-O)/16S rRNA (cytidine1409-2'-O)-methyltransferase